MCETCRLVLNRPEPLPSVPDMWQAAFSESEVPPHETIQGFADQPSTVYDPETGQHITKPVPLGQPSWNF